MNTSIMKKSIRVYGTKLVGINQPKGYKKFRSYREGMKAAKDGESYANCPYELDEETRKTLLKRDRWMKGFEEVRYRAKRKKA